MAAGVFPLTVEQYSLFQISLTFLEADGVTPVNLIGYEGQFDFAPCFESTPFYTGTTGDQYGSLTIPTPTNGIVIMTIPAVVTGGALFAQHGPSWVYTLDLMAPSQDPIRYMQGEVTFSQGIQAFQPQ